MVTSVRHEHLMSYRDYEVNERVNWVLLWPGMVVLCVSQIYWSMDVTNALASQMASSMLALKKKLHSQILDMVNLVKGRSTKLWILSSKVHLHVSNRSTVKTGKDYHECAHYD